MRAKDVKIGGVYTAKVTDRVTQIRIDAANRHGGWDGTNLKTKKRIRIKSALRLRTAVDAGEAPAPKKERKLDHSVLAGVFPAPKKTAVPVPQIDAPAGSTVLGLRPTPATEPATEATASTPAAKGGKAKGAMSGLDAAAAVLGEAAEPLNTRTILDRAVSRNLWAPEGRTPNATLNAALHRDIATKGDASRFRKAGRGLFTLAG